MDFNALVKAFLQLKREFVEHRHSGLDSKKLDLSEQIDSQGSLTPASEDVVDTTYGAEEADVINNTRARVNEIENALKAFGILE